MLLRGWMAGLLCQDYALLCQDACGKGSGSGSGNGSGNGQRQWLWLVAVVSRSLFDIEVGRPVKHQKGEGKAEWNVCSVRATGASNKGDRNLIRARFECDKMCSTARFCESEKAETSGSATGGMMWDVWDVAGTRDYCVMMGAAGMQHAAALMDWRSPAPLGSRRAGMDTSDGRRNASLECWFGASSGAQCQVGRV